MSHRTINGQRYRIGRSRDPRDGHLYVIAVHPEQGDTRIAGPFVSGLHAERWFDGFAHGLDLRQHVGRDEAVQLISALRERWAAEADLDNRRSTHYPSDSRRAFVARARAGALLECARDLAVLMVDAYGFDAEPTEAPDPTHRQRQKDINREEGT